MVTGRETRGQGRENEEIGDVVTTDEIRFFGSTEPVSASSVKKTISDIVNNSYVSIYFVPGTRTP